MHSLLYSGLRGASLLLRLNADRLMAAGALAAALLVAAQIYAPMTVPH